MEKKVLPIHSPEELDSVLNKFVQYRPEERSFIIMPLRGGGPVAQIPYSPEFSSPEDVVTHENLVIYDGSPVVLYYIGEDPPAHSEEAYRFLRQREELKEAGAEVLMIRRLSLEQVAVIFERMPFRSAIPQEDFDANDRRLEEELKKRAEAVSND